MFVQTCNAFSENTVVLHDGEGGAIVFDPGMSSPAEWAEFEHSLEERGWTPKAVLMTHAHLDHVLGCAGMASRYGLHPQLFAADEPTYGMAPRAAEMYGVPMDPLPPLHPTRLEDGKSIQLGKLVLEVKWTPGHAPGHVVFVDAANQRVIGGDVLFQGSVGRTDLPGGDSDILAQSIEKVLYALPDSFEVWPGHGPSTTIGREKRSNPFVNGEGTGMMQVGR